MSVRALARKIGVSPTFISNLKKGVKFADLPTALKIEKATHGEVKVEQIVRPEVARALKEYLKLRCPTSKTSSPEEQLKSDKKNKEVTVD